MTYIYAIYCMGHVKIGISSDPKKRAWKVQADCPYPVKLLGYMEGGQFVEKAIHEQFADYRVRGEWFEHQGPVMDWVQTLSLPQVDASRDKLTEHLKAQRGRAVRLAEYLGLAPSTLSQWKNVPPEHVRKVSEFTGLSKADLRPDLFEDTPPPQADNGARESAAS